MSTRINKTNKTTPVSADELLIYDSQDTSDDKNITLGQVATFTENQNSSIAGTKIFQNGVELQKGSIAFGQYSPLPTGIGSYIAQYTHPTYGARLLGYNGLNYQDLNIGSMPTAGSFSIKSLANGDCNFGYNANITGNCTANKFYGDGSKLTGIISGVSEFDNKGTVTTDITLVENKITTGYWSGTNTITLPTITDTTKQVVCILDFTTASSAYPIINKTKSLTGTISVTNGSATVAGTGTLFTTELQVGDTLIIASVEYKVTTIASNISLTLTSTYAGTTASGLTVGRKIIRWSDKTSGKAPNAYSILTNIRNELKFKSIWEGGLLYWEVEYTSYGGTEVAWVQPVLANNGTLGDSNTELACYNSSISNGSVYQLFNGVSSGYIGECTSPIYFSTAKSLKVSELQIRNSYTDTNGAWLTGQVYGSNDNSTYVLLKTFSNSIVTAGITWTIDMSDNTSYYKYHEIVVSIGNGGYKRASKVTIIGTYIPE